MMASLPKSLPDTPVPDRSKQPWEPHEDQALAATMGSHGAVQALAVELGRSVRALYRRRARLEEMGDQLLVEEIRRRLPRRGLQQRVAHELGISQASLANILHGRQGITDAVAARLGFRRVVRWARIETKAE